MSGNTYHVRSATRHHEASGKVTGCAAILQVDRNGNWQRLSSLSMFLDATTSIVAYAEYKRRWHVGEERNGVSFINSFLLGVISWRKPGKGVLLPPLFHNEITWREYSESAFYDALAVCWAIEQDRERAAEQRLQVCETLGLSSHELRACVTRLRKHIEGGQGILSEEELERVELPFGTEPIMVIQRDQTWGSW